VLAGDRAGDGEAEADAAGLGVARALDAVERFEDLLAFAARNAGPAILDSEDDESALGFQGRLRVTTIFAALSTKLEIARRNAAGRPETVTPRIPE
jgi:hypothetical protein